MHTDRALAYGTWALELVAQQKCGYRIIRSIDKVLEDKARSARAFGETLKTLLKDAIALWQRDHAGGIDDYTREAQNITQAIDRHLKPRSLDDPDNQRLWTCSVLTIRYLIRFLPTPLPVHPDNLQPSGDASPQDQAAREADSLINYAKSKYLTPALV